jgi:DNA-binding NtrC family response regulator
MRILLVEDDNMIGHSLRQALTETGLSVDWVRDGVLAESALAQGSYAAALGTGSVAASEARGQSHADARAHRA